jgi:hypothetical protein
MEIRKTKLLYLLLIVVLSSCNRVVDFSDADKDNPLSRNDDNVIFQSGKMFRYSVRYVDPKGLEKVVLMNQFNLDDDNSYPVVNIDSSFAYQQDQVKSISIFVEEAQVDNVTNPDQTTIRYQYYDGLGELIPFDSKTGVIDNQFNIWLHPPRTSSFKILNLSAYPFVKFPLQIGKKWEYELKVGKYWGHPDFGKEWTKDVLLFTHTYEVKDKEKLTIGGKVIDCFHIQAQTESEIGTSSSNFYYNEKYGFVVMEFNNLNGSEMQFEIIL